MNFDKIAKKVKKFGQNTITEIQKINDVRQLNSQVEDEKKRMKAVYQKIGEKIYQQYKDKGYEELETEFQDITECEETIETLKEQIRDIKGKRICPNCKTEITLKEQYCSVCGHKLPPVLKVEEQEDGKQIIDGVEAEIIDISQPQNSLSPAKEEAEEKEETSGREAEEEIEEGKEEAEEIEEIKETEREIEEVKEAAEEIVEAAEAAEAEITERKE